MLRSIHHTVKAAHAHSRWTGVCGEMASDPRHAVLLVGLGVDELSVTAFDLPRVKAAIRAVSRAQARALADEALVMPSAETVDELIRCTLDPLLPAAVLHQHHHP